METYSRIGLPKSFDVFVVFSFEIRRIIESTIVFFKSKQPECSIFSTRFECILHLYHSFRVYFTSSPLVSSVDLEPSSLRWELKNCINCFPLFGNLTHSPLKLLTLLKIHSKRVEKIQNYTRNEWRRCKTTLEKSGEHTSSNLKTSPPEFSCKNEDISLISFSTPKGLHSFRV